MKGLKLKIGVLSMASLGMVGMVISSALAAIIQSFPDVEVSTVQMLSTLPGLGALVITLIAGQMATYISKKKLVLLGIGLVIIGGLVPAVWNNSILELLVCSVIMGTGVGFISTLSPMLLSQYFEGEERSAMMGINTAVTSLGAVFLIAIGGMLGASNWRHVYWVYSIAIIVLVLTFICLPEDVVEVDEDAVNRNKMNKTSFKERLKSLNPLVYVILFVVFLLGTAYTAYMANLSIVISEKGIGGTQITALINAVGTIGGVATGLGLKYIRKVTKTDTLAFGFIFLVIAILLTYYSTSVPVLMIGAIFSGVSMVMVLATSPYLLSILSQPFQIPLVMSIYAFVNSLSGAIAPKIIALLGVPFGAPSFVFAGTIASVVAIVLIVTRFGARIERRHEQKH